MTSSAIKEVFSRLSLTIGSFVRGSPSANGPFLLGDVGSIAVFDELPPCEPVPHRRFHLGEEEK